MTEFCLRWKDKAYDAGDSTVESVTLDGMGFSIRASYGYKSGVAKETFNLLAPATFALDPTPSVVPVKIWGSDPSGTFSIALGIHKLWAFIQKCQTVAIPTDAPFARGPFAQLNATKPFGAALWTADTSIVSGTKYFGLRGAPSAFDAWIWTYSHGDWSAPSVMWQGWAGFGRELEKARKELNITEDTSQYDPFFTGWIATLPALPTL
jgi:hypothetical protein